MLERYFTEPDEAGWLTPPRWSSSAAASSGSRRARSRRRRTGSTSGSTGRCGCWPRPAGASSSPASASPARRAEDRGDAHVHRHAGELPAPDRLAARGSRDRRAERRRDRAEQERGVAGPVRAGRVAPAARRADHRHHRRAGFSAGPGGDGDARRLGGRGGLSPRPGARRRARRPPWPLGDALAVVLLELKGFRREDFAALHPGGSIGRRLLLRVRDVMLPPGRVLAARRHDAGGGREPRPRPRARHGRHGRTADGRAHHR